MTEQAEALKPPLTEAERNGHAATLTTSGLCDSSEATRIVDALAKHGFTIYDYPTSAHGGAIDNVFADLNSHARNSLGEWVNARITGSTTAEWPHWLRSALVGAENGDDIIAGRETLREKLADAETAIRAVRNVYAQLTGPLYDVEHAEGDTLFQHYLAKTERALHTAIVVNPTR